MRRWRFFLLLPLWGVVFLSLGTLIGALVPLHSAFKDTDDGIDVYFVSNGIHVDIVVPIKSSAIDWAQRLPEQDFWHSDRRVNYVAFGWGDKAIFLEAAAWSDLKLSTGLKALFGFNGSVMHVSPYYIPSGADISSPAIERVRLSPEQLKKLTDYIETGFVAEGVPHKIAQDVYVSNDAFYEATGRYSLLMTCNEWVRRGLFQTGIRSPLWSPFAQPLLYQLRNRAS